MAEHNELGKEGEVAAVNFLKNKGYEILHTNWRRGRYELDIVAKFQDELIVTEVKTRTGVPLSAPQEALDKHKIRNIVQAADLYIKTFDTDLPVRFDLISITGYYPHFNIEHIEDAFYPPMNTYR